MNAKTPIRTVKVFLILLVIGWVGINLNACVEDPPPPEDLGFFPLEEIRDYLYFQQGTYWVYKGMTDERLDTVVLIASQIDTFARGNELRKFTYEELFFATISRLLKEKYTYYFPVGGLRGNGTNWNYFYLVDRKRAIYNENPEGYFFDGADNVFSKPVERYNNGGDSSFRLGTLQFHGRTFQDVLMFQLSSDGSQDSKLTRYYWAKNYGLIKRERINRDTRQVDEGWELYDGIFIQ
jgi:hypothetical protein